MDSDQKTIAITYDDATRMMDYCKDESMSISREFYDWYLGHGNFFVKKGLLTLEFEKKYTSKYYLNFDLTDPDNSYFELFGYQNKYAICRFYFNRQENLTMENIAYELKYFNQRIYREENMILCPEDIRSRVTKIVKELSGMRNNVAYKTNATVKSKGALIQKAFDKLMSDSIKSNIQFFIYSVYATMYYISKQEVEEMPLLSSVPEGEVENTVKVKSTYKYTGYIDLRNNKTYKPVIKRDPNEPIREYQRHIQAWTVRGHYRRTSSGMIWIEPHIKGSGDVEQRVYSTLDKQDLNLTAKVFEVERTVKFNENTLPKVQSEAIDSTKNSKIYPENYGFVQKIKRVWGNIFTSLFKKKVA